MVSKQDLEMSLKDAMRAQDELRKRTLRMALATAKLAEVEKGAPLDTADVMGVLQREVKARQETIAEAKRGDRHDLVAQAEAEIEVLRSYLPQPLTQAELADLVRGVIAEVGAASPADMGKVMKVLTPLLQGRATGAEASQVVRQLLA